MRPGWLPGRECSPASKDEPLHPCGCRWKVHKGRAYLVSSRIYRVLRYCHHIVMDRRAMAGQQECPKLSSVPVILCLCRLVPETAE